MALPAESAGLRWFIARLSVIAHKNHPHDVCSVWMYILTVTRYCFDSVCFVPAHPFFFSHGGGRGQSLLVVFEENILPTYRSKFVQFVLFFACSRSPGLSYVLSAKLVDVLRDELKPKVTWR